MLLSDTNKPNWQKAQKWIHPFTYAIIPRSEQQVSRAMANKEHEEIMERVSRSELQKKATDAICIYYAIPHSALECRNREQRVANARQVLYYFLNKGGFSLAKIGKLLKRHHTTVMHGVEEIEKKRCKDGNFYKELTDISNLIIGKTAKQTLN